MEERDRESRELVNADLKPEWVEQISPIECKVYLGSEDDYAIVRSMKTKDQVRVGKLKKKVSDVEFALEITECSVTEWSLRNPENGEVLPIPSSLDKHRREKEIWEHVPNRWYQRIATATLCVNDPDGDGLGGLSYRVFEREDRRVEQER